MEAWAVSWLWMLQSGAVSLTCPAVEFYATDVLDWWKGKSAPRLQLALRGIALCC